MADQSQWQNRIVRTGTRPAREFVFHEQNWREHPQSQRAALNEILSSVGWIQGVIYNSRTNRLIDGHARIEEALKLSPDAPVPFTEVDLSPEEERLMLLLFDPIGSLAETNAAQFLELSESIELDAAALLDVIAQMNVAAIPFSPENLLDVSAAPLEAAAQLNEKWRVKKGDLWRIGDHLLLCADATDETDVRRLMNDEKAELLFTSPPYSDQRSYSGKDDLSPSFLAKFINAFAPFCRYQIVNLGIVRRDYEIDEYWNHYIEAARESGYKLLSWNIWDRGQANGIGQQTAMFAIDHEFLFVFGERVKKLIQTVPTKQSSADRQQYKHRRSRRNVKGELELSEKAEATKPYKQLGTVVRLPCANTIGESTHPAMFPVSLPAVHIEAMTKKNQIVCEPFAGSGTTIIACENLQRKCRAMEINPEYAAVTLERMEKTFGLKPQLLK